MNDALNRLHVFNRLSHSSAQLEGAVTLGDGMALAIWRNQLDAVSYAPQGHHTLSCYLDGGYDTFLRGRPEQRGAPGRLCVLPDRQETDWVVNGHLRFLHLYFSPEQFASQTLTLLDREPREMCLPQQTFFDNPQLARLCHALPRLDWSDPGQRLQGNALAHQAVAQLIQSQLEPRQYPRLKGGLSAALRRRMIEWLDNRIDQPLTLGAMAAEAALSETHFAHMFRISFGMPPHVWLQTRRLSKARQLLVQERLSLTEVAMACGYSSPSHFSNRFRAALGITPSRYRELNRRQTRLEW
ncbi:helix-turn-helix domain-containing protein [Herminiimonas sp. CN]|uniref:helix-turn-helix domain-containing protein n=1 Tax=Herminiimonas sp. CN TaxID=1349818 RepID=UPI000473C91C|nr:AraC family transcriptional regulator [Herminiimonas sp. CN]